MKDMSDYITAFNVVQDPSAPASSLMLISQYHPSLREMVAAHPNADSHLLEWLSGDPQIQHIDNRSEPMGNPSFTASVPMTPPLPTAGVIPTVNQKKPHFPRWQILFIVLLAVMLVTGVIIGVRSLTFSPEEEMTQDSGQIGGEVYILAGSEADLLEDIIITEDGVVHAVGSSSSSDGIFQGLGQPGTKQGIIVTIGEDDKLDIYMTPVPQYLLEPTGNGRSFAVGTTHADEEVVISEIDETGIPNPSTLTLEGLLFPSDIDFSKNEGVVLLGRDATSEILTKIAHNGSVIWSKRIADFRLPDIYLRSTAVADDGSIFAVGYMRDKELSISEDVDWTDVYVSILCKFDSQGNTQWVKEYGNFMGPSFFTIALAPDGSPVVVGMTRPNAGDMRSEKGALIAKFDTSGEILWFQGYGGESDSFFDVAVDDDDTIVAVGHSFSLVGDFRQNPAYGSGSEGAVIAKISSEGSLLWGQMWTGNQAQALAVAIGPLGRICASGSSAGGGVFEPHGGGEDAFIICVNQL